MGAMRQKRQEQLAFPFVEGSEASRSETEGTEAPRARREAEDPAGDSITNRTAVYGSVRTVVWEGWRSDPSPYPDRSRSPPREISLRLGDDRFMSSVAQGLRPAKFHEKGEELR